MKLLRNFIENLVATIFAVVIIILTAQIFFRYVLNSSLSWSEELVRYSFVWLVFLGGALGIERGAHMMVDLLVERLRPKAKKWVYVINYIFTIIFLFFLMYQGFELTLKTFDNVSPAMEIPMAWVYSAIPVGSILMLLFCVYRLYRLLKKGAAELEKDALNEETLSA